MRRPITAALVVVVVLGSVVLPARGGTIAGTLAGNSTLAPTPSPGVFIQSFVGVGADTALGDFTAGSTSIIDFGDPPNIVITDGSFAEVFAQGMLFGTSSGRGTASGAGTATVTIDLVFTRGTGLFAGATGQATLTGTLTGGFPGTSPTTQTFTGSYEGSLSIVPEPSAPALLAPVAAVGAVLVACRKKRSI